MTRENLAGDSTKMQTRARRRVQSATVAQNKCRAPARGENGDGGALSAARALDEEQQQTLPSCPRFSRASTSCFEYVKKEGVDGRNKSGHDAEMLCSPIATRFWYLSLRR